jgi:hypothetical protein
MLGHVVVGDDHRFSTANSAMTDPSSAKTCDDACL